MAAANPLSEVSPLLRQHLTKLLDKYLSRSDAIEVCINQPGEVWVETSSGWQQHKDARITEQAVNDFLSALATERKQSYGEKVPFLGTTIPGYEFRIQAVGGAVASEGIALAIRCGRKQRFPIENYFSDPADAARLVELVKKGGNFLVAGPTGSGKTTFLNSLLVHIPMELRLALVEDSRELVVDHPNHYRLLKSKSGTDIAKVSWEQIVDALMRLSPGGILFSEIDIRNTIPFLLLMNTGHKYCFATIHANEGAQDAVRRMVLNALMGGMTASPELVREYATKELDAVIFIHREGRARYRASVEYLHDA